MCVYVFAHLYLCVYLRIQLCLNLHVCIADYRGQQEATQVLTYTFTLLRLCVQLCDVHVCIVDYRGLQEATEVLATTTMKARLLKKQTSVECGLERPKAAKETQILCVCISEKCRGARKFGVS